MFEHNLKLVEKHYTSLKDEDEGKNGSFYVYNICMSQPLADDCSHNFSAFLFGVVLAAINSVLPAIEPYRLFAGTMQSSVAKEI